MLVHPPLKNDEEESGATDLENVAVEYDNLVPGANGFICRAHLLVPARECFGNLDEMRETREPVAAHNEAKPVTAFLEPLVLAFVNERVIGAAARFHIL